VQLLKEVGLGIKVHEDITRELDNLGNIVVIVFVMRLRLRFVVTDRSH
jgi:hypothetical protein